MNCRYYFSLSIFQLFPLRIWAYTYIYMCIYMLIYTRMHQPWCYPIGIKFLLFLITYTPNTSRVCLVESVDVCVCIYIYFLSNFIELLIMYFCFAFQIYETFCSSEIYMWHQARLMNKLSKLLNSILIQL